MATEPVHPFACYDPGSALRLQGICGSGMLRGEFFPKTHTNKTAGIAASGYISLNQPEFGVARAGSALARLEAALGFVDDVKTATAANNLVVAMAFFQRFQ